MHSCGLHMQKQMSAYKAKASKLSCRYASSMLLEAQKWHMKQYIEVIKDITPQQLRVIKSEVHSPANYRSCLLHSSTSSHAWP